MNANRNTLGCYEDVPDVLVSRKESVFPMATHLDMGNNYIYSVKTPVNNDQGANKSYAKTKLSLTGGVMRGNLDMNNNGYIIWLNQMETTNQPQKITDTNFLFLNGNSAMAGPLNMSNNNI